MAGGGGRGPCRELVLFTPARGGKDQQQHFEGLCLCRGGGYGWNWLVKGSRRQQRGDEFAQRREGAEVMAQSHMLLGSALQGAGAA